MLLFLVIASLCLFRTHSIDVEWGETSFFTSEQITLEKSSSQMTSADGIMSFNFIPTKDIGIIHWVGLSLSGFDFLDLTIFQFTTVAQKTGDTSVTVNLTLWSTTKIGYLKYFVICVSEEGAQYIFIESYSSSGFFNISGYTSSQKIQRLDLNLPDDRIYKSRLKTSYIFATCSYKAQAYSNKLSMNYQTSNFVEDSNAFDVRYSLRCGRITQLELTMIAFNYSAGYKDKISFNAKGHTEVCPKDQYGNTVLTCEQVISGSFGFGFTSQRNNFKYNSFFYFYYFTLSIYGYSQKYLSIEVNETGIESLSLQIYNNYDYFYYTSFLVEKGSCEGGFVLAGSEACEQCQPPPFCRKCSAGFTCSQCLDGYYLNEYQNCKTCTIIDNCLLCLSNEVCIGCQVGYFVEDGSCILCSDILDNCQECDDRITCSLCQPQFYLEDGLCKLCSDTNLNCLHCNVPQICLQCKEGYLQNGGSCTKCQNYLPNCNDCSDSSLCTSCNIGYYLINNQCIRCEQTIQDCSLCDSDGVCLLCIDETFYPSEGICKICSDAIYNCHKCRDENECVLCSQGFYVYDGKCLSCSVSIPGCNICVDQNICLDPSDSENSDSNSNQNTNSQNNSSTDSNTDSGTTPDNETVYDQSSLQENITAINQEVLKIKEETKKLEDLIVASVAVLGGAVVGIVGVGALIAKKVSAASVGASQVAPGSQAVNSQNVSSREIKNQIETFESSHKILEQQFNTIQLEIAE